jgi:hypothetical protein
LARDSRRILAYRQSIMTNRAAFYFYWFGYPHHPAEVGARLV